MTTRRELLLQMSLVAPLAIEANANASRAAPIGPISGSAARALFQVPNGRILLNAANLGPGYRTASKAQAVAAASVVSDPSFENRVQFSALSELVRSGLAGLLGADPEEIAIVRNASEGNTVIATGVPVGAGAEVVLTSHNHPSNLDSWRARARRDGFSIKIVPTPLHAANPNEVLDPIREALSPSTRVLAVSHITNTTGLVYPIEAISTLTRKAGIWLHVDGAQSFGNRPLDMATLGCDSFATSAHKWFLGPIETGLLFIRRGRIADIPQIVWSADYWQKGSEGIRRFEKLGQRDDARLVGLACTVEIAQWLGITRIGHRIDALATRLRTSLAQVPGVRIVGAADGDLIGPIVLAGVPPDSLGSIGVSLKRRGVAFTVMDDPDHPGLRFAPHIYNTEAEVDRVVGWVADALDQIRSSRGHS